MLGAHMSIAGGIPRAVDRAVEVGARAIQIFVKNNNRWLGRQLLDDEVQQFRSRVREELLTATVAHASYLINLASPDPHLWEKSIAALIEELERCQRLGLSHLVIHPGSHVGSGIDAGSRQIIRAINRIHSDTRGQDVRLALETTAGQGTQIGCTFPQLARIFHATREPERLAVCLDTCHVFAAGYEIRSAAAYRQTIEEFDGAVGLPQLQVIHFNDSKRPLGSRVDRHENIGVGEIGAGAFRHFLLDPRLLRVPKILETPKEPEGTGDIRNLAVLKSLCPTEN